MPRTSLVGWLLAWPTVLLLGGSARAGAQQQWFPQQQTSRSWIGVSVEDVQPDKPEGARVVSVEPDAPAAKAGVRDGDVIVEFDGERVRSRNQFGRLVGETPAGRPVKMAIVRDGKRVELSVTPEAESRRYQRFIPDFREGPNSPSVRPRVMPPYPFDLDPHIVPPLWRSPEASLGIRVQDLTPQLRDYFGTKDGVLVASVTGDSPASRAGLKAGDVITAIDGREVLSATDVRNALRGKQAGDQVKLTVVRDRRTQPITVTILER